MQKPNFFIVGAPKCGTTALSEYLREHPNVFMCTPKEPHYFATDFPKKRLVSTEKEYLSLFSQANNSHVAIGEASVWYLYSHEAIANIKKFNSFSKIVVMLRNPVDVVYSMHSQLLYGRWEDQVDFRVAWELCDKRKKGFLLPSNYKEVSLFYYDEIARFGEQIERLLSIFPIEQVKIIFFEDFSRHTDQQYRDVLHFLGVPDRKKTQYKKINPNKYHRLNWLADFTQHPPKILVNAGLKFKRAIGIDRLNIIDTLRTVNKVETARPKMDEDIRRIIIESYHDDILKLSKITGRDLSHWINSGQNIYSKTNDKVK